MVTTILNGGLGNQLFQISVACALAIDNNDMCAFDFSRTVVNQGNKADAYKGNLYFYLDNLMPDWEPAYVYKEPKFNYRPIEYHKDMQLEGYFQSLKYFNNNKEAIYGLFLNDKTDLVIKTLRLKFDSILRNKTASLHVRRGDYLKFRNIHPQQDLTYYQQAIDYINADYFLVFSDDIEWCKANIRGDRMVFVGGQYDYEDMLLMSLCDHNIIAGSSFSWWGAFLNRNKNKIVIAPKRWFGEGFKGSWSDIYTEDMITL